MVSTITFNATFSVKDILRDPSIRKALRDREEAYLKNIAWLDEDLAEKRHLENIAWLNEDYKKQKKILEFLDYVSRGRTLFNYTPKKKSGVKWIEVFSSDKKKRFIIETPDEGSRPAIMKQRYGVLSAIPTKREMDFIKYQLNHWEQELKQIKNPEKPQLYHGSPRPAYHLDKLRMFPDLKEQLKLLHD